MSTKDLVGRVLVLAGLVGWAVVPGRAQSRLLVTDSSGGPYPVVRMHGDTPSVLKGGQVVEVTGRRYALGKADEFLPALVELRDWQVTVSDPGAGDYMSSAGRTYLFSANLVSPFGLADVVFAVELDLGDGARGVYATEVGSLEPWSPRPFVFKVTPSRPPVNGTYVVHLYSGGDEVLQSRQAPAFREEKLNQMVAKRVAAVKQGGLQPLYTPAPEYPRDLLESGVKGRAVIAVRVTPGGEADNVAVKEATDPRFGEAAASAVRTWHFVPRVQNGRAVESDVAIPIGFAPPDTPEKH